MQPHLWQFLVVTFAGWINRSQQDAIEYLKEENRVLRKQLGGRRLFFTDDQRRRLAVKAQALGRNGLKDVTELVTPDKLLRWYRRLVATKYDGSQRRGPGRPQVAKAIRELVVKISTENPSWGYTRICGALRNVDHDVGRSTVKRILAAHGIEPAPERRKRIPWSTFLKAHWGAIAATDFFTVEVLTAGLQELYCRRSGNRCRWSASASPNMFGVPSVGFFAHYGDGVSSWVRRSPARPRAREATVAARC